MPHPFGPSITSAQSRARSPHIAAIVAAEPSCVVVESVIEELASVAGDQSRKVGYVGRFLWAGRKRSAVRRHADQPYQFLEPGGRDDEQHSAAIGADAIAVRDVA